MTWNGDLPAPFTLAHHNKTQRCQQADHFGTVQLQSQHLGNTLGAEGYWCNIWKIAFADGLDDWPRLPANDIEEQAGRALHRLPRKMRVDTPLVAVRSVRM